MSVKFQITLPDPLFHDLKRAAARQQKPLAQWIRETMEARLKEKPATADPFTQITGLVTTDDRIRP
jgi:hypothetical protein